MTERSRFRWAWWLLAYVSLGIGIVGIFVPGLPTTVFILIAAYAASRGSERLHRYLLQHPRFGPMIRDWQAARRGVAPGEMDGDADHAGLRAGPAGDHVLGRHAIAGGWRPCPSPAWRWWRHGCGCVRSRRRA